MNNTIEHIQLGRTEMMISPMGLGTWAWGDRIFWKYGDGYTREDLTEVFQASVDAGINFIDTAETYGFGSSEKILKSILTKDIVVATKFFPYPWRLTPRSLVSGLRGSLKRLGASSIDLYIMHWPFPPISIESWMDAMTEAFNEGLIKAVGVSNYNPSQMEQADLRLQKHGLRLAANQVHFSLLHRQSELDGLIKTCRQENISVIAYSPLGQGLLTGKYVPGGPMPKGLNRLGNKRLIKDLQPLINELRNIGETMGGKTPAQVAINWVIQKGCIPIVGAKNRHQAEENAGAMGWNLPEEQIAILDSFSNVVSAAFPLPYS